MTKFNKSLLTAAVVGALALPSLASAATLTYVNGKQTWFAKDLIVNDGISIYTPSQLMLAGEAADNTRLTTVALGEEVRVKVTLTNGARFDSTADPEVLAADFTIGAHLGGADAAIGAALLDAYYSASGSELNFSFSAPGAGAYVAGEYAIELNSMQITNLVAGLFTGSAVGAEITVQNSDGQQILASKQTVARSKWGLAVEGDPTDGDTAATIDVGSDPRKTVFSSVGLVGAADATTFNAGSITVDIAQGDLIGGGTDYVNNFSAVALDPNYNIVTTADITVTVTGNDLSAFEDDLVWLDQDIACGGINAVAGEVDGGVATFETAADHPLWASVTNAPPGPSTAYVCFGSDGETEMQAQALAGSVSVAYNLSTQRVDPPAEAFELLPLRLNGTTLYFQNVNPGDNPTAQSFLRLTNHNSQICPVVIDAKDDAGRLSDSVTLTLQPHASAQINTTGLDGGSYPNGLVTSTGIAGSLGDGTGKWYVRVTAECANFVGSALNRNNDTGTVTNLTPQSDGHIEWSTPTAKVNP